MGKDKKAKKRSTGLTEDILESKTVKPSGRLKQRRERQGESDDTVRHEAERRYKLYVSWAKKSCSKKQNLRSGVAFSAILLLIRA